MKTPTDNYVHVTTYLGYDIVHAADPIPYFTLVDRKIEHYFETLRDAMDWCDIQFNRKWTRR